MTSSFSTPPKESFGVTSGPATANVESFVAGLLHDAGRMVDPIYRLGPPHERPHVVIRVFRRPSVGVARSIMDDTWRLPRLSMGPSSATFVCVGHEAGTVRWLRERENDAGPVLVTADREQGTVELEIYDHTIETMRGVSRMIAYVLSGQLELAGAPAFHGSAVARDGSGVLMLGSAGSGKSTLAFQICTLAGWSFVADDLVHVWRRAGSGPPLLAGWPKRVAVSSEALLEHPQRATFERARLRWHGGTVGPLDQIQQQSSDPLHRARLYWDLEEFFPITGVSGVPEARLAGVVLPSVEPERVGWRVEPVGDTTWWDDPECRASTRQRKHGIDFLGILPYRPPDRAERARVLGLVRSVPCVRLRYGHAVGGHIPALWADVAARLAVG